MLKKIIWIAAWLAGFTAAVTFLVAVFLPDRNPVLDRTWKLCAISGLVAFCFEKWLSFVEGRRTGFLSEQLVAAQKELLNVQDRLADRRLTEEDKGAWKEKLSTYRGQPFKVIQIGVANSEAASFAKDIGATLGACGWVGSVQMYVEAPNDFKIYSGIALFLGHPLAGQKGWPAEAAKALGALFEAIRTSKIREGAAFAQPFLINGEIGIVVGQKG